VYVQIQNNGCWVTPSLSYSYLFVSDEAVMYIFPVWTRVCNRVVLPFKILRELPNRISGGMYGFTSFKQLSSFLICIPVFVKQRWWRQIWTFLKKNLEIIIVFINSYYSISNSTNTCIAIGRLQFGPTQQAVSKEVRPKSLIVCV